MQHFYRVVAHDAQVFNALFMSGRQTCADAGRMHFNAEEILLRRAFAIATRDAPMPKPISSVTGASRPNNVAKSTGASLNSTPITGQ